MSEDKGFFIQNLLMIIFWIFLTVFSFTFSIKFGIIITVLNIIGGFILGKKLKWIWLVLAIVLIYFSDDYFTFNVVLIISFVVIAFAQLKYRGQEPVNKARDEVIKSFNSMDAQTQNIEYLKLKEKNRQLIESQRRQAQGALESAKQKKPVSPTATSASSADQANFWVLNNYSKSLHEQDFEEENRQKYLAREREEQEYERQCQHEEEELRRREEEYQYRQRMEREDQEAREREREKQQKRRKAEAAEERQRKEDEAYFYRKKGGPQWKVDAADDALGRSSRDRDYENEKYAARCRECNELESDCRCCRYCEKYPCECCDECGYAYCRCCSRCGHYRCEC